MRIVNQIHLIEYITPDPLQVIERAARTCYKSEDQITKESAVELVRKLIARGHEAMLEFAYLSVRFVTDRGVSHELVRHRLCSFAQESTRYCNYQKGDHMEFIMPSWFTRIEVGEYDFQRIDVTDQAYIDNEGLWFAQMIWSEKTYNQLIKEKWSPQQARSVLPNSLKTEIVVSANFREWRHILKLRCSKSAHPQMRQLMLPLLADLNDLCPEIFAGLL